jgi:hypothetical protein
VGVIENFYLGFIKKGRHQKFLGAFWFIWVATSSARDKESGAAPK